ncbi:MAG: LacI family DNA-binding transcriptional regulator [Anaerolineales bacterium]
MKHFSSSTTIRDVAKHAKVSIATVSRVLNDSGGVREKTREKVLATIEELNYTPNAIARQLSIGRTLTIGIIQPYITLPSYIERLRGVQQYLANTEYDLVIFSVDNPDQKDAYFKDLSRKLRVDGMLIVSLPPTDEQAENFSASRIPTVMIDADHPKLCCIVADDIEGGRMATQHLVELGHRKIAFLTDYLDTPFHPAMRLRFNGYREVLQEHNIPFNPDYLIEGMRGRINARIMAKKLLALDDPPTAIFASSDTQALGILDVALETGVKVPEQLSVIGYDNIPDAVYNNLTTIDQSLYDSGMKGAEMLLNLLGGLIHPPRKQYVSLNLRWRKTTGPPTSK